MLGVSKYSYSKSGGSILKNSYRVIHTKKNISYTYKRVEVDSVDEY